MFLIWKNFEGNLSIAFILILLNQTSLNCLDLRNEIIS